MRTTAWKTPIRIENPETGLIRTVKTIREAKTVLDRLLARLSRQPASPGGRGLQRGTERRRRSQ